MRVIIKPAGAIAFAGVISIITAVFTIRSLRSELTKVPESAPIEGFTPKKSKPTEIFNASAEMEVVDLDKTGSLDWICWGVGSVDKPVRKAGGGRYFRDYSMIVASSKVMAEGKKGLSRAFRWNKGDRALPGDVVYPGVHTNEENNGFRLDIPVDTADHTATIYVGGWQSGGEFRAFLTDGSNVTINKEDIALNKGYYSRAYRLTFKATTPGAELKVVWKRTSGNGNISLQAATMK